MSNPANLARDDKRQLAAILDGCPELAAVQAHVQAFAELMTERRGHDLANWMNAITTSGEPGAALVRHRAAPRPGRCDSRAHPAMELRARSKDTSTLNRSSP